MPLVQKLFRRPIALWLLSILGCQLIAFSPAVAARLSRQQKPSSRSARTRAGARPVNPQIAKLVKEIDPRNIEATIRKLVSFGTRNTLSEQDNPKRGIGAARDWLYGEFQKAAAASEGRMTVEKQTFEQPKGPRVPQPTVLTNVVATLKGTQPESEKRVYVVSGHYDSMCRSAIDAKCDAPGANDDASGTAAVLEMARVMARYKFDATIIFMTVPGEEQSLLGATHFAEEARKTNMNIEAMFTNDIIGSSLGANGVRDPHTVRVFSEGVPNDTTNAATPRGIAANVLAALRANGGENDSQSRQLARFIKETSERYVRSMRVWMIYRRDRFGRGGDHQPFLERGYAAVRFSEPNENFNHQHQNVRVENGIQYGDLPEFDDFKYIADVARVNAAALAALASAPARPKNAVFPPGQGIDTAIKWDANKEPDLAGYEIVWRDTTEATWTHSQSVGNVLTFTVKGMSKDNYSFGVRAIDKDGHKSPVSYPRPQPRAPRADPTTQDPPQ